MNRREFLEAGVGLAASLPVLPQRWRDHTEIWTFDTAGRVGGYPALASGHPRLVPSPRGPATAFDGVTDALFIDRHPLAGACTFSFEALFRPDGGEAAQRWFHLEQVDDPTMRPGTGPTRMLFEIRVTPAGWYLDAFVTGRGYKMALMSPDRLHPLRQWHYVRQTYDGQMFRSFVNGELQMEAAIAFSPQGPGRCAIGCRLDRVDHFRGAVRMARFTRDPYG